MQRQAARGTKGAWLDRWRAPLAGAAALGAAAGGFALAGQSISPGLGLPVGLAVSTASIAFLIWIVYRRLESGARRTSQDIHRDLAALAVLAPAAPGFLPHSRWSLEPAVLVRLLHQIGSRGVRTVIECGSGVSTLLVASFFKSHVPGGHVYSIEHDAQWAAYVRVLLSGQGLDAFATVIVAPLQNQSVGTQTASWYSPAALEALPPGASVDLLLVDGPPGVGSKLARYPAVPVLQGRLAPGALVILDDGNREDEARTARLWEDLLGVAPTRITTGHGQWEFDLAARSAKAGR